MNPVEIEHALCDLAEQHFDPIEFPFRFLECFGNKATTLKRLRSGTSNKSDVEKGVLQRSNIHLATCDVGEVSQTLQGLRNSPATTKAKAPLVLETDGHDLQAENVVTGETVVCDYKDFPDHFGFFLPLAGIATTAEIRNNAIDIKATVRLNRLYVELLKHNEDWGSADRRHDMNQFMTRLIFCFFAEDTGIFQRDNMFTQSVEQMSDGRSENTHEVVSTLFHALNLDPNDREKEGLPRWTKDYPYVNGGLFAGTRDVPKFSRIARSYLIHAGNLNWEKINPDIFGSMIQAVADDEERGSIGMHYTSVPNILKVLNPLFLDDLKEHLNEAGDNARKLKNLKKRISKIRVFDPACGSGNFLVISYKEMRAIEFEVNKRRKETHLKSEIPLSNFRGIEIREFPTEIARLALIIAEYQCDELYRGQKDALADFLPLDSKNWIVSGNALRLDWLSICPSKEKSVKHRADDLFHTPLDQAQIDFENEGGETFICSNPPYLGRKYQSDEQKAELKSVFLGRTKNTLSLDYVSGWFMKAIDFMKYAEADAAFVSTNSICQGIQVSALWPVVFREGIKISFAYHSFKWANLATHNAGVTVSIIGLTKKNGLRHIFTTGKTGELTMKKVDNINAYLVGAPNVFITQRNRVPDDRTPMQFGNHPYYANELMLKAEEAQNLVSKDADMLEFIRPLYGSKELISGSPRACIWITEKMRAKAEGIPEIQRRVEAVQNARKVKTKDIQAQKLVSTPYRFRDQFEAKKQLIIVPIVSSENRPYLPVGYVTAHSLVHNKAFALYDATLWNMALIASRLHWVWIGTVCVRMRTDFSYSNTLGWNTFPVPTLTKKNKDDLKDCAEEILLAREAHFPKSIADLYKTDEMPDNLRQAHEKNDETLERIYIGRRFKNDTERLEKLFELYSKMTTTEAQS
jgi:hypothetical protein